MCRFYRFLYSILPFKIIRSFLIKKHISVCNICHSNYQYEKSLSELEDIKIWASKENSLWPEISSCLQAQISIGAEAKKSIKSLPFKIWCLATTSIIVTIFIMISFAIFKGKKRDIHSKEALLTESLQKVILKRAELRGKKARPIIYQSPSVSIIILVEGEEPGGINE